MLGPWLASLATAAGAELRCSTLITRLHREGGRVAGVVDEHGAVYRAPIVIGADGVLSTVAREAGIRERWTRDEVVLVPQLDFAVEPERLDEFLGDESLACWWGVDFPTAYQVFFRDGFHIGLGNWLDAWDQDAMTPLRRVVDLPDFQRLIRVGSIRESSRSRRSHPGRSLRRRCCRFHSLRCWCHRPPPSSHLTLRCRSLR